MRDARSATEVHGAGNDSPVLITSGFAGTERAIGREPFAARSVFPSSSSKRKLSLACKPSIPSKLLGLVRRNIRRKGMSSLPSPTHGEDHVARWTETAEKWSVIETLCK